MADIELRPEGFSFSFLSSIETSSMLLPLPGIDATSLIDRHRLMRSAPACHATTRLPRPVDTTSMLRRARSGADGCLDGPRVPNAAAAWDRNDQLSQAGNRAHFPVAERQTKAVAETPLSPRILWTFEASVSRSRARSNDETRSSKK